MLEDPNFRRSPQCGYYEAEYILKRSASILEFPVKRITLNPEQEVDVQTVRFSQPFILYEGKSSYIFYRNSLFVFNIISLIPAIR
jgi:hypothetical protein